MNPKISIIIPVYNVEKYLDRCMNSILNQTFEKYEIILVDDGSTDESKKKCDYYANEYENIFVIHKTNGGLSEARNTGIDIANAELICFVDSDDYLHPQYLEILYKTMIHTNADIVECKFSQTTSDNIFEIRESNKNFSIETMTGVEYLKRRKGYPVAWNKLYKKFLFEDVRYPVGMIHEDEGTTYKLVYKAPIVTCISVVLYGYYKNDNGIMNSKFNKKRLDIIPIQQAKIDFFKSKKEQMIYEIEMKRYCNIILKNYYLCKIHNMRLEALGLKRLYDSIWFEVFKYKNVNYKSKIILLISRLNHSIYGKYILRLIKKQDKDLP